MTLRTVFEARGWWYISPLKDDQGNIVGWAREGPFSTRGEAEAAGR